MHPSITLAPTPDDDLTSTATATGPDDRRLRPRLRLVAPAPLPPSRPDPTDDEDGSLITEYGLLAVVAATVAGVVISWASNGQIVALFNALIRAARGLVGA